jgi:hypothetical protein
MPCVQAELRGDLDEGGCRIVRVVDRVRRPGSVPGVPRTPATSFGDGEFARNQLSREQELEHHPIAVDERIVQRAVVSALERGAHELSVSEPSMIDELR